MATKTPVEEPITVRLRGTGGAVFDMELEVLRRSEPLMAQIDQGALRPADARSAATLIEHEIQVGPR